MAKCPECDSGKCPECNGTSHTFIGDLARNIPMPGSEDDDQPTCIRCENGDGKCTNCGGTGEVEDD